MPNSLSLFNGADEGAVVTEFNRNGYYLHRGLFNHQAAIDAAAWLKAQDPKTLLKSWTEQEPGVPLAVYTVAHKGENPIADLATNPKILEMAEKMMGHPTYIWASKVNLKAAWCGTVEYYHQDLVYWKDRGYPSDDMLTCLVFFEKHNINNSALHLFPGTHRLGFIPHKSFININGLSKRMVPPDTLNRLYKEHGLVTIDAEPGDALFFHTSLVHGSSHNISPGGRMILLVQLNAVGNEPENVLTQTREFNILRAKEEYEEAGRRYKHFKEKYEKQVASDDPTFCAPIPDKEK